MIETGVGFVGEPPVLALDKDGKLDEQTLANLSLFLKNVAAALNGGLRVGPEGPPLFFGYDLPAEMRAVGGQRAGNLSAQVCQFVFWSPGVEYDIPHSLGRKPLGVIHLHSLAAASLYSVNVAGWSATTLKLACSIAARVTFLIL